MTGLRWRIVAASVAASLIALAFFVGVPFRPGSMGAENPDSALPALLLPMALSIVLALIAAIPLSRLAVQPLARSVERVAHGAGEIARGGEPPAAEPFWDDELVPLATALREMTIAIKSQIAAVEAERARLATILAHMGDGVIMIGGDGRIALINSAAARLLGTSAAAADGHSLVDIARDHELVAAARRPLAGAPLDEPLLLEMGVPRRTVQVVSSAVPAENGQPAGSLLLLQDVTELRRAETMRREFVANVSHELRTPVASLKALAETLEGGALEDPPAARLFLTRMLLETDRLAQLVEELLELALLESGAAKLEREPFDVAEIIPRATERLHAHAFQHGVDLIVQACPTPALIIGDALRLERVLINLVDNAVKFTAPGGRVIIACDVRNDQVVVSVNDTGAGIPAQDVGRVFERFYKADRARASAGTGLGLAIAKHTVEAHNGRIWVESVEGAGSTFSFSIPEAPPPPAVPAGQVRARSNGR
jgi:two-component system, OmpR family, phosphate regulon sensor histidine kinase PhoR